MAWAVEEFKDILQKAYPGWYKSKNKKARKEIEQHVVELMQQANIARQRTKKCVLAEPKIGFSHVNLYIIFVLHSHKLVGNQKLVFKCLKVCGERCHSTYWWCRGGGERW